jgi:hypothetical protein
VRVCAFVFLFFQIKLLCFFIISLNIFFSSPISNNNIYYKNHKNETLIRVASLATHRAYVAHKLRVAMLLAQKEERTRWKLQTAAAACTTVCLRARALLSLM